MFGTPVVLLFIGCFVQDVAVAEECRDAIPQCPHLKRLCGRHPYLTKNCPKTCGACNGGLPFTPGRCVEPCLNGGKCYSKQFGARWFNLCQCRIGWKGTACEKRDGLVKWPNGKSISGLLEEQPSVPEVPIEPESPPSFEDLITIFEDPNAIFEDPNATLDDLEELNGPDWIKDQDDLGELPSGKSFFSGLLKAVAGMADEVNWVDFHNNLWGVKSKPEVPVETEFPPDYGDGFYEDKEDDADDAWWVTSKLEEQPSVPEVLVEPEVPIVPELPIDPASPPSIDELNAIMAELEQAKEDEASGPPEVPIDYGNEYYEDVTVDADDADVWF